MAKKIYFIAIICFLFCSCASTRQVDRDILAYQAEIDRLESELRSRDRAVDNAVRKLENITTRSIGIEGTVDELIELFDEYQQAVEQLLRDYRDAEKQDKVSMESVRNMSCYISNAHVAHDSRFYCIRKRYTSASLA